MPGSFAKLGRGSEVSLRDIIICGPLRVEVVSSSSSSEEVDVDWGCNSFGDTGFSEAKVVGVYKEGFNRASALRLRLCVLLDSVEGERRECRRDMRSECGREVE
jgi:hypothetical protein